MAELLTETRKLGPAWAQFEAYWTQPAGTGRSNPGIVLVHTLRGLTEHERALARVFSELGYTCVVPDLYSHAKMQIPSEDAAEVESILGSVPFEGTFVTGFEKAIASRSRQDQERLRKAARVGVFAPDPNALSDLKVCVATLRATPGVDHERIACIGLSMGGGYAWTLATVEPRVKATVVFYGRPLLPYDQMERLKGSVLAIHAGEDTRLVELLPEIEQEMASRGQSFTHITYPNVHHGFMNPLVRSYHQGCARDAIFQVLTFLQESEGMLPPEAELALQGRKLPAEAAPPGRAAETPVPPVVQEPSPTEAAPTLDGAATSAEAVQEESTEEPEPEPVQDGSSAEVTPEVSEDGAEQAPEGAMEPEPSSSAEDETPSAPITEETPDEGAAQPTEPEAEPTVVEAAGEAEPEQAEPEPSEEARADEGTGAPEQEEETVLPEAPSAPMTPPEEEAEEEQHEEVVQGEEEEPSEAAPTPPQPPAVVSPPPKGPEVAVASKGAPPSRGTPSEKPAAAATATPPTAPPRWKSPVTAADVELLIKGHTPLGSTRPTKTSAKAPPAKKTSERKPSPSEVVKERAQAAERERQKERAREREREQEKERALAAEKERQKERARERERELAREREKEREKEKERERQRELERERARQKERARSRESSREKERAREKPREKESPKPSAKAKAPERTKGPSRKAK